MKKLMVLALVLIFPSLAQAMDIITYTPIQTFPERMIAGSTYTAKYLLKSNANIDIPVLITFNITRSIPFDWSEFNFSVEIDNLKLECFQISLGYWECWKDGEFFVFPKKAEKNLTLELSLHIAASPTNLNYSLRVVGGREIGGKIAFLCRDSCDDGIEPGLINWLTLNGWEVDAKPYYEWTDEDLDYHSLMICSEEEACDAKPDSVIYKEHKYQNMGFLEIPSSRMIKGAYNFEYTTYDRGFESPIFNNLYLTRWDPITNGYNTSTNIFKKLGRMTVITDSRLSDEVIDLSDVFRDFRMSTLFKVNEWDTHGRYAYVGWFYKSWFFLNDLLPSHLNSDGEFILKRVVNWVQCGNVDGCPVYADVIPPIAFNGTPVGDIPFDNPPIYVSTNEDAVCKGSIDKDETFAEMDFHFISTGTSHKYRITTPLSQGEHTVYVRCRDVNRNIMNTSYNWSFTVKIPSSREVAFLCREDDCNYKIEDELINWLKKGGWSVSGKAYNSWTLDELKDYDLIICSDELKACKVDVGTPAYRAHKEFAKPFVEIGDYTYLSAAWRFGYVKNPYGGVRREQLYITRSDPITQSFLPLTEIISGRVGMVTIPDYYLQPMVIDLADSGDNNRSTLFKVEQNDDHGRYVYVGWFYQSNISDLTPAGETILRRAINWVHCERKLSSYSSENFL
jgi:hypothetical protein